MKYMSEKNPNPWELVLTDIQLYKPSPNDEDDVVMKALVIINDQLLIRDIDIIQSERNLYIHMPREVSAETAFPLNIVGILTESFREKFIRQILDKYKEHIKKEDTTSGTE